MAERVRDDLIHLVHRGLGVREFALDAARILRREVPFDGVCVLTLDPATLLPTGEVMENGLPADATPRLTELEFGEADFNKFDALARGPRSAATLSEATEGLLDRSRRHHEVKRPHGFGDELRAALTCDSGTWGALTLLRETTSPHFTPEQADVVAAVAPLLAEGLRQAIVRSALSAETLGDPEETGLVLLADDNTVLESNPAADRWLDELASGDGLPPVVRAVASRIRSGGEQPGVARARLRTASGTWLLVHGSRLGTQTAVILEPARAPELAPLIADAYGLTARERTVTQLVAQGYPTTAIAEHLHLSTWTVQDHLKAIFEKAGVSSRGELIARLFFEHHLPRLTADAPLGADGAFADPR